MPEISIVIPTFNSGKFIKPCLDSLFAQDYQDIEVIVVDNGSEDGTVSFIKENYPQIIFIENKENLGACKARNQGIEISKGSWILTLDCDITLGDDFIAEILNEIKNLSLKIGTIQPKILKDDRETIYSMGIFLSSLKKFYDIGKGKKDCEKFDESKYVFGACSAAALYNRKMLEEIKEDNGYFDERFFFLAEDVDLAWRAQKKNWKALYCTDAICYHYGNSSSLNRSLRQFLCWRNRKLLLEKCRINRFKLTIIYLIYDLPRIVFLSLTNSYVRNVILNKNNSDIISFNKINLIPK